MAFKSAIESLRAFIDQAVETYPVDRERLVVSGFSQGGLMAYELALREPRRFSGLVAMSTWLPGCSRRPCPGCRSTRVFRFWCCMARTIR